MRNIKSFSRILCALTVSLLAFAGCTEKGGEVEPSASSFVIRGAGESVVKFAAGERISYPVEAENIARTNISQPAGWTAEYDDVTLAITAPESKSGASATGDVVVKYVGADGVSGQVAIHVEVEFDDPDEPEKPTPTGSIDVLAAANGNTVEFMIKPDNAKTPYQITLDSKTNYDSFSSDAEFVAFDIEYWKSEYGNDYASTLVTDMQQGGFEDIPDGTYVVCAYYVDLATSTGYGFNKAVVTVGNGGSVGPTPTPSEPVLGLAYEIGDGEPFGFPGQGVVVCYVDPNEAVYDWYYGIYLPKDCNGRPDEDIRAGLKMYEELHGQMVEVYPYDWDTDVVLCGFYIDAEGNEGPIERIPLVVSLNPSEKWNYDDYLGDWTVSGTGVRGNNVEYEISIKENMRNDSYNVFGFTRTGKDVSCNAPVKASFKNGAMVFYENSTLGIDSESGNWLGFLGYAYDTADPSNKGYFNINHQTIATGVRSGNNILLDWKTFTYEGYKLKYYTFVYGYLIEDQYRDETFYLYDADLQDYIVSDMVITKKGAASNVASRPARRVFVRRGIAR